MYFGELFQFIPPCFAELQCGVSAQDYCCWLITLCVRFLRHFSLNVKTLVISCLMIIQTTDIFYIYTIFFHIFFDLTNFIYLVHIHIRYLFAILCKSKRQFYE